MTKKKSKEASIDFTFKLKNIESLSFSYANLSKKYRKKIGDIVQINVSYVFETLHKKEEAILILKVSIVNKETSREICLAETKFIFGIRNMERLINGNSFISKQIPLTLVSISYSTFRGQIFEKLKGTPLENIPPIPVIDPNLLLEN